MNIDWISCIVLFKFIIIWILLFIFKNPFQYYIKTVSFFTISAIYCVFFIIFAIFRLKNSFKIYYMSKTIKHIYKIFSIKYIIENIEYLQIDKPYVLISNHQSAFDYMPLMKLWPNKNFSLIAKRELCLMWPIGLALWLCDFTFINRSNKVKAKETINKLCERIKNENISVFIFPEGTRSPNRLLPFKKGAFHLAINAQVVFEIIFTAYLKYFNMIN